MAAGSTPNWRMSSTMDADVCSAAGWLQAASNKTSTPVTKRLSCIIQPPFKDASFAPIAYHGYVSFFTG